MKVLFICTGNTCRSPMAEKILTKKSKEKNLNLVIKSAGISAIEGYYASKNAREVIKEYDIDEVHTTTRVTKELLKWADIILTMTLDHKRLLLESEPDIYNKVYTLKELVILNSDSKDSWEKINKLYSQIEFKKQEFYASNGKEINQLEERYNSLVDEIKQVELELNQYTRHLKDNIREELQEIDRLEKKLPSLDIKDPFGENVIIYREIAKEIEDALDKLLNMRFFEKQ